VRAERRCALGLLKAHSSQRPAVGQPERQQYERCALDVALDALDNALNDLIDTIEAGGLEQLDAAEKISWWRRCETLRKRLPLIDHSLIADATASALPKAYCTSTMTQFLVRIFQLSPGEAAGRVRAAAAVGPRRPCSENA
jgi:hypothetical protein